MFTVMVAVTVVGKVTVLVGTVLVLGRVSVGVRCRLDPNYLLIYVSISVAIYFIVGILCLQYGLG